MSADVNSIMTMNLPAPVLLANALLKDKGKFVFLFLSHRTFRLFLTLIAPVSLLLLFYSGTRMLPHWLLFTSGSLNSSGNHVVSEYHL